MKRRFTLLAIATFLSGTLMAAWDGSTKTAPSAGDGSEGSPYQIKTEENLAWLAYTSDKWGKHFIQTADLDLGNHQLDEPIGNSSTKFTGSYNGDGYVISNLYYNDNTKSNVGLFGYTSGATLTKITVASGSIYGSGATGGICGYATGGSTISYCANNASVYGKQEQNGGICGFVSDATISNCINYGLISGFNFIGGIAGRCSTNDVTIEKCVNVGQIFSMCATSGCILGFNDDYKTIEHISNNYFDNQINTLNGSTSKKDGNEPSGDYSGKFRGMATTDLTGDGLKSILGENEWEYATGMYPRLKLKNNNDEILLAATTVILSSGDKADNVTKDFTVSTENNVSWESEENTANISINGNNVSILKSTGVVLIAKKESHTKRVYLKTNKIGATAIGSEESPLTIENEADLNNLRKAMNNYGTYKNCTNYDGFKGIHFKVIVDIELSNWQEPIGSHNAFKGVFDGNHRTISNINIDQSCSSVGGLFGCAASGEIKNITVRGSVDGKDLIGGICGAVFDETLTNCISYCVLNCNGKAQVGGISGDDRGFSTFINCENHGAINCGQRSGGILGRSQMDVTLNGCKNYGNVTSNSDNIGGICGQIASTSGGGTITSCENHGVVKSQSKTNVGGIIGSTTNKVSHDITITNCINSGSVKGNKHTGGIIGHPYYATIENCLNLGDISGEESIGGISGSNETIVTISNVFNAGQIEGGNGIVGVIKGNSSCINGINIGKVSNLAIGNNETHNSYAISNFFFDKQMSLATANGSSKLTSEMTGTALLSTLGTDNWTYTDGMYPMIKALDNSDYMIVAASPIILNGEEKIDNVNKNFTYGAGEGVEWTCSNHEYISFANGTGYLTYYIEENAPETPASVTITATKKVNDIEISKTIPLTLIPKVGKDSPEASLSISPNEFVYGTIFTEDLLTKSAACDGAWEYSVPLGSKPQAGLHTLTATFVPSDDLYDIQTISVDFTVTKKEPTIEWYPQNITYGDSDSDEKIKNAKAKDGDVVLSGVFSYNIPVLTPGEKIVTVTFSNTNYEITTISVEKNTKKTINVTAATPSIAWANPTPIEYGTPLSSLQLGAVSGVGGTFTYTANGESIDIGTTLNVGTYTLIATLPAAGNYSAASLERTLVVNKATPTITWNNTTVTINYGETVSEDRLKASVENKYNDKGSISYSVNGQPIDIRSQLEAGTYEISATFTPDDNANYSAATTSSTATLTVKPITPTITWNNTTVTINYGETVSEDRLKASVEDDYKNKGSISYSVDGQPFDIRAQLAVGTYTVIATFTPNDTHNYVPVTTPVSATITVNKSATPPTITWNPATPIVYGTALSNAQLNANANAPGTITYAENGNTVTVGTVLSAGDHIITATLPASDNYDAATAQVTITVSKATPEISWTPEDYTYGDSEDMINTKIKNASASFNGANVLGEFAY
ncbi:MAG: hypothetical protein IJ911_13415, partial [Salinivirgaceae bacterium]|nr:hypothetical protein [Salinivirgaceae bacterium]